MNSVRVAKAAWASMRRLARSRIVCGAALSLIILAFLFSKARDEFVRGSSAKAARELIQAGQFEEAGGPLARWIQHAPDSAEARFLAARRAFGLHGFDEGFAELDAARKLGYSQNAIDRERGIVYSRLGRLALAEPILRRLFMDREDDHASDPALDEALARCYIENFQLHAAEGVVKRWIADAPLDPKARYWHADLRRRKAGIELASLIDDYEHVLRLDDRYDQARIPLAELYLAAHRLGDAEKQYATYLQRHPDDVEACLGMGRVAAEDGRDDLAIQFLDRSMKFAPGDIRPLVERGKLESRRGRFAAALEYFDRAVGLDSPEPEIHYQRSLVLAAMGRAGDAMKERAEVSRLRKEKEGLDKLLEDLRKSPADTELELRAARWFFDHGHPEAGLRWAEKILREHPRNAEASKLLADQYEKQGKPGLANFYRLQSR
jgi:tetratricopeptide (TPR) repeat protein